MERYNKGWEWDRICFFIYARSNNGFSNKLLIKFLNKYQKSNELGYGYMNDSLLLYS